MGNTSNGRYDYLTACEASAALVVIMPRAQPLKWWRWILIEAGEFEKGFWELV
jgi:hypothetical protein